MSGITYKFVNETLAFSRSLFISEFKQTMKLNVAIIQKYFEVAVCRILDMCCYKYVNAEEMLISLHFLHFSFFILNCMKRLINSQSLTVFLTYLSSIYLVMTKI